MDSIKSLVFIGISLVMSAVIAYFVTPFAIKFARKIGAIDVPADGRRMHKRPVPLLGGISIIAAFVFTSVVMYPLHNMLLQILPGALLIAVLGVLDDKMDLPAWPKLFVQCVAAGIAVSSGVRIQFITGSVRLLGTQTFDLGWLSIPITILWIVGITNAVNFIDGLDGLAAGISSIASASMLFIAIFQQQYDVAILTASLTGGCLGLLPFNRNPARVFMGDTGATFLGFVLAVISIQGLFKFYAAISFAVPLLVLGLPIFDTASAIVRRIYEGKSPFCADRNHIHHKLIDMGMSQKQAVAVLYITSLALGAIAIFFTLYGAITGWRFLIAGLLFICVIFFISVVVIRRYNAKIALKAAADKKDVTVSPSDNTDEKNVVQEPTQNPTGPEPNQPLPDKNEQTAVPLEDQQPGLQDPDQAEKTHTGSNP